MNHKVWRMMTLILLLVAMLGGATAVLAVPNLVNTGKTVDESSVNNVITSSELSVSDADAPTAVYIYTLNTVPAQGTLSLNGVALIAGSQFTQSNINSNQLTYSHTAANTSPDDFQFDVSDDLGIIFANQVFDITIKQVNNAPTANSDSLTVAEGGTVMQTTTGATSLLANDTDPNGDPLVMTTSPTSGPSNGSVTLNANGTFSYTHNGSENLSDTFTYQVCDTPSGGPSRCNNGTVDVTVTGVVDVPPSFKSSPTFGVNENSPDGTVVGTVTANDPEVEAGYDSLTYSITAGNIGGAFSIGASTGQIKVLDGSQLDFEGGPKTYNLTVQATDTGAGMDTTAVTINVQDVNEQPQINNQGFSIDENSPGNDLVGAVAATDVDNDNLTYTITAGNSPGTPFKINSSTGVIRVNNSASLDYETKSTYNLTVLVTDDGAGNLFDSATVTISLNDVNEAPVVNNRTFNIDENSPINNSVGTVNSSDPDAGDSVTYKITGGNTGTTFKINASTGQISVANTGLLDFETMTQFQLTIEVKDEGGLTDTATVTINVKDVNEAPSITNGQEFTIAENSPENEMVGTVAATDVDAGDSLTFSIVGGDPNNIFKIDNDGIIRVNSGAILDFEEQSSYTLTIQVEDEDGLTNEQTVEISVTDVNEKPTVVSNQQFAVFGSSQVGTFVGNVQAFDPDTGDSLTFAITSGNTNNAFKIDNTGQLVVNNRDAINYNSVQSFTLTIKVTDSKGLTDSKTVVVNLLPPPISLVFMPLIQNEYRADEPNNSCAEAYPIGINATNSFLAEDKEDWYEFTITTGSNVTIELSNFVPAIGQIIAYRGSCGSLQFIKNNGNFATTKVLNLGPLSPGTYYIRIITDGAFNDADSYNLIVRQ